MSEPQHLKATVGCVYLVGAGPGDPGLLTLRGAECLARADLILYDGLVNPLLLRHSHASAERTCRVDGPTGRVIRQEEIHERLIDAARSGKTVHFRAGIRRGRRTGSSRYSFRSRSGNDGSHGSRSLHGNLTDASRSVIRCGLRHRTRRSEEIFVTRLSDTVCLPRNTRLLYGTASTGNDRRIAERGW